MSEIIEVRRRLLEANDQRAAALRARFEEAGTLVTDVVSSPGAGKTTLLQQTVARLRERWRCAVLVGDVATENDARRIREAEVPAHQIVTGGACHLDAHLVADGLSEAAFDAPELLFVENVGNLVCPASYDLGEDFKTVLLSVTEGDDKPEKYPAMFARAEVCLLTKTDLLPHVPFDVAAARARVEALNPQVRFLEVAALGGQGLEAWCALLEEKLAAKRGAARV